MALSVGNILASKLPFFEGFVNCFSPVAGFWLGGVGGYTEGVLGSFHFQNNSRSDIRCMGGSRKAHLLLLVQM